MRTYTVLSADTPDGGCMTVLTEEYEGEPSEHFVHGAIVEGSAKVEGEVTVAGPASRMLAPNYASDD